MRPLLSAGLCALLGGCLSEPIAEQTEASGSTTSDASDATGSGPVMSTTTTAGPTVTSNPTTPPETGADSSTGAAGPGEGEACELHEQDCAEGLKCMPYSSDGSFWWNDVACFPIVPDPQEAGEPCQWEGGLWSGHDNCGLGEVCWTFDEDEPGVCKSVCLMSKPGDWDSLYCEDPATLPIVGCQDCFCVCESPCDPLEQNCDEGQTCVPSSDTFLCTPDASGEMGEAGDPCEFVNVCNPGLFCIESTAVAGCEASLGCCSPVCDLSQPNTCPGQAEGETCQPWYERATPGLENVGICALPPA